MEQHLYDDKEKMLHFVRRVLQLENEIKGIKEDIKQVKQEAKEEGLLIKEINKAISEIKRDFKKNQKPGEATLVDEIKDILLDDADVKNTLQELVEA